MIGERRTAYRRRINLPSVYTITGNHFSISREATTGDISDRGVCLYTDFDLKKGSVLEVNIPGVFESPRRGTVRWILRKYFNTFKVGVEFVPERRDESG